MTDAERRELTRAEQAEPNEVRAQPDQPPGDRWLRRKQAAAYADVSVQTIDRARLAGDLQSARAGRARVFRQSWIDAWLTGGGSAAMIAYMLMMVALACLVAGPVCHHHCLFK